MDISILVASIAYLLTAIAFVIDKYLLALPIPKPFSYAFGVAVLSASVVFLIPFFEITIPGGFFFLIAFISGAAFFGGLIFLYKAVRKTDVSVASTQVGVTTSIFTYIFSFIILNDVLPLNSTVAIALLVCGMIFLGRVGKGVTWHAILSGILIAFSFVLLKWTFAQLGFVNGIFWTRIGFVSAALLSLVSSRARKEIHEVTKTSSNKSKIIFVINKILAGSAFILLYYAILLGNVAVINALLGLQFLFVFLIAVAVRKKIPSIGENIEKRTLIPKLIGIVLVFSGFLTMFA